MPGATPLQNYLPKPTTFQTMKTKHSPLSALKLAISSMLGRVRRSSPPSVTGVVTSPPRDAYHQTQLAIRPRQIGTMNPRIAIEDSGATRSHVNQKKVRKNRRRAFAAGNRKAFA